MQVKPHRAPSGRSIRIAALAILALISSQAPGAASSAQPAPHDDPIPKVYLTEIEVLHLGGTPGLPNPNYPGENGEITAGHAWYEFKCAWEGCGFHDIRFDVNWSAFPTVLTPGGTFTLDASAHGKIDVSRQGYPLTKLAQACFQRIDGANQMECVVVSTPDLDPQDPNMEGEQKTLTYSIPVSARYGYNLGVHVKAGDGKLDAMVWYKYKPPQQPWVEDVAENYIARDTSLDLTVSGNHLISGSTIEILKRDGTVDGDFTVFAPTASADGKLLEVRVSAGPNAALGPRGLRVRSEGGVSEILEDAFEVIALRLEVNQGAVVSDLADRVAGHPTVVRVSVESLFKIPRMTGLLYVFDGVYDGASQVSKSPFQPNFPAGRPSDQLKDRLDVKRTYSDQERFFLRDSLNFYSDPEPPNDTLYAGKFTYVVAFSAVDPAQEIGKFPSLTKGQLLERRDFVVWEASPAYTFVDTRSLRVLVVSDPALPRSEQDRNLLNQQAAAFPYFEAVLPLDATGVGFTSLTLKKDALDIDALNSWWCVGNALDCWVNAIFRQLNTILKDANELTSTSADRYDRIVLLLKKEKIREITGDDDTVGLSDTKGAGLAVMVSEASQTTLAHEIGHTYGLGDTYANPSATSWANPRDPGAPPEGNRVEYGAVRLAPIVDERKTPWSTELRAAASVDADGDAAPGVSSTALYRWVSFMGTSDGNPKNMWTTAAEWTHLLHQFRTTPLSAAGTASPVEVLSVSGALDISGQLVVDEVARRTADAAPPAPEPGDLILEQLDAAGAVLSSTSFGVDYRRPGVALVRQANLDVEALVAPAARQLRIRQGAQVLMSRAISANAPSVQVTAPAAGQVVAGPTTLRWTGSDADGDALTYSVYYLRDGATPLALALDLAATSLDWDPAGQGGGPARIAVIASDGVNRGRAFSPDFTVSKQGPSVTILGPLEGALLPEGTIELTGGGLDPEDGFLPPDALTWQSSLAGALGDGDVLTTTLGIGTHVITLHGVDSDGNDASAAVTVNVGSNPWVPVITDITPSAAPRGAQVTISGRNLPYDPRIVWFGDASTTGTQGNSSTITVTVPLAAALGDVMVTAQKGASDRSNPIRFTVARGRPELRALEPVGGSPGTLVLLRGSEFAPPGGEDRIFFGSVQAPVLADESGGLLTAVPDGLAPGQVAVTVRSAGASSDPLPFEVTAGAPAGPVVITALEPAAAQRGARVVIRGQGFSSVAARNEVTVGGVPASSDVRPDGAIEMIVPWDAPAGEAIVLVRANGFPSNPFTLVFEGGGRHWLPLILKQAGAPGPASPTPTRTGTAATPTATQTSSRTPTPTIHPSVTPTSTPTTTPTRTPTGTPSATPTRTPTATTTPGGCTWRDDFSSATLDSRWVFMPEDPTHWSLTARPGYLRIITQEADVRADANVPQNLLYSPEPRGDFEISAHVEIAPAQPRQQAVLLMFADPDNYVQVGRVYDSTAGGQVEMVAELDGAPLAVAAPTSLTDIYLKLRKVGTIFTAYTSADGLNWTQLGQTMQPNLDLAMLALSAWNGSPSGAAEIPADFDWVCLD